MKFWFVGVQVLLEGVDDRRARGRHGERRTTHARLGKDLLPGPPFLGLLVALPVFGHATWHLYRSTTCEPD